MVCHKTILAPNLKKYLSGGGVSTKYSQNLLLTHYSKIITTNVAAHFQSRIQPHNQNQTLNYLKNSIKAHSGRQWRSQGEEHRGTGPLF